jgi:hypothetical protein
MTAEERLQELLDCKDVEIDELQEKLCKAEERAESNHKWTVHVEAETDDRPELPVPRLEMRWEDLGEWGDGSGYHTHVRYDLVYRHYLGHIVRVPIGSTRTSDKIDAVCRSGSIGLPYRDGAHILHDMGHLQLPAFGIVRDRVDRLTPGYVYDKSTATQSGVDHRSPGNPE